MLPPLSDEYRKLRRELLQRLHSAPAVCSSNISPSPPTEQKVLAARGLRTTGEAATKHTQIPEHSDGNAHVAGKGTKRAKPNDDNGAEAASNVPVDAETGKRLTAPPAQGPKLKRARKVPKVRGGREA